MPNYSQYNVQHSDTCVNFGVGQPDTRKLPLEMIKSSLRTLGTNLNENEVLQYGQIPGYQRFRETLASWLTKKYYDDDRTVNKDNLFVSTGNTGALHQIITIFTSPGNTIYVEDPSYFLAINIFKEYGLNVVPIPMQDDGLNLDVFESELKKSKEDQVFLYTIPFCHNPTGVSMSEEKKQRLGRMCDKYSSLCVLSDEVYHFLGGFSSTTKTKTLPLADYHKNIITLGTFSKILAPSLRLGWIYSTNETKDGVIHKLKNSAVMDSCGGLNTLSSLIVESLINNGKLDKYINECVEFLSSRCRTMVKYLNENSIYFVEPDGGYFLWLDLELGDTRKFLPFAMEHKIKFHTGNKFSCSKEDFSNYIRLSFSYYNEEDSIIGLERLIKSINIYKRTKVAIHGETGRLGSLIKEQVEISDEYYNIGSIVTKDESGREYNINKNTQIIIDVSSPEGTKCLLEKLLEGEFKIPLLIGTTGELDKSLLKRYCSIAPVAVISNFSEGIPMVKKLLEYMNSLSDTWKFSMIEKHHQHKKDAPSGTALTLKNHISRNCEIESVREGEIFGQHFVTIESDNEIIELKHTAKTRRIFADGTLRYIPWLLRTENGLYYEFEGKDMSQLLSVFKLSSNTKYCLYSGSGNILMIVDSYDGDKEEHTLLLSENIKKLDGVIFLSVDLLDFYNPCYKWEYYNRDGNKVDFCGNGARCVAQYIKENYDDEDNDLVNGDITTEFSIDNDNICIEMPYPEDIHFEYDLEKSITDEMKQIGIMTFDEMTIVKVGVPHIVIEIESNHSKLESDIINFYGSLIMECYKRYNDNEEININFMFYDNDNNKLIVRTFERGVNRETGACGSGCLASFYYYIKTYESSKSSKMLEDNSIDIEVSTGEILKGEIRNYNYYLSGKVQKLDISTFE